MSNRLGKKITQGLLALFIFYTPSLAFSGTDEFVSYTLVKNISNGDDPSGSSYTMATNKDELRYLISITNTGDQKNTYTIETILPQGITLKPQSTQEFRSFDWVNISNINDSNIQIRLRPKETVFYRFTANVTQSLSDENLILTTTVKITDQKQNINSHATKVYIPKLQVSPIEHEKYQNLTSEQKENVDQILEQKNISMQQALEKIFESQKNNSEESLNTSEDIEIEQKSKTDFTYLIVGVLLLIVGFLIYKHQYEKH